MITPAYSLTATERVLPRLALDFTTAVLDPRVTVTRALNTGTVVNSSGTLEVVNANLPRFDYDPSTLVCQGLLVEESRTNLLLNSLIDGTSLATQSVNLSAVAYTLSFYGTGSVSISGGHSATVAGTGAYPSRRTYTFTPTAGSSTFTVTGTVQYAQLEAGSFVTSFIPTAGASATRNADRVTMAGANFTSWYNSTAGTLYAEAMQPVLMNTSRVAATLSDGTDTNRITLYRQAAGSINGIIFPTGAVWSSSGVTATAGVAWEQAIGFTTSAATYAANAVLGTNTSYTVPLNVLNTLTIGASAAAASFLCGYVRKIMYYPQKITNAELVAITKL